MDVNDVQWLNDRELRAWQGFQLMQMQVEGELARRLAADSSLSYSDYGVLVALTDQPDGRLRQFELGQLLAWEQSRLSHHITRMAKRDLVTKEKCDTDQRGAFVVVTDHGRAEIVAAAPGHVAAVRQLFVDLLTPEQLDVIAEVSETVLAAAGLVPIDFIRQAVAQRPSRIAASEGP